MALESPLFLSKVECPVCGTINEFETIRVGAYTEGERMTDFCPSLIKWRNPKYQKYNPLLFFAATCSNCYYTREFNNRYKEWHKDNNFRTYRLKTIKEKHLNNLASEKSFIKLIGGLLDNDKYPDETAILKLLLAVFDELLNDHPSNLDLGRFYLRVAWMFRYINAGQNRSEDEFNSGHLADIERSINDLQSWQAGFGRNIEYLNNAVDAQFDTGTETDSGTDSLRQSFNSILRKLASLEEQTGQVISELDGMPTMVRQAASGPAPTDYGNPFYDYTGFEESLAEFLRLWDGVPRSEREAMRMAVHYYISAFETGREISRGNQSIQAAYLIAELSRQIGDHDTARQYFNTTIKRGQEFIREIKGDRTRTALTRKILELALGQGRKNLAEAKS